MENTYTMIADDGAQYGPVTLEQLKGWIAEQRVGATTKILRSDTKSWLPASDYPELGFVTVVTPASTPPPFGASAATPVSGARYDPVAIQQTRSGARWFFWIAGLSVVNTLMANRGAGMSIHAQTPHHGGSTPVFLFGLGITQVIDGIAEQSSNAAVATGINIVIAGVFILLGVLASKGHGWSFILGMILYALDAVIFLTASLWLGLAFHAYVLFRLFVAWQANRSAKLN